MAQGLTRELIEDTIREIEAGITESADEQGLALLPRFTAALRAVTEEDVLMAIVANSTHTTAAFNARLDELPHPRVAMVELAEAVRGFNFVDDHSQALMQRGFAVGWLAARSGQYETIRETSEREGGETLDALNEQMTELRALAEAE